MTKYRQCKKNALKDFKIGSDERYWRTHCAICEKHMDIVRDKYFNQYGFCSVKCGMEIFGMNSGNETFYILGLVLLVVSVTLVFIFAIGWALAELFIG